MTLSSDLVSIEIKTTILRPLRHVYLTRQLLELLHLFVLGGFYLPNKASNAARVFSVNK